jgi:hypothetical protein
MPRLNEKKHTIAVVQALSPKILNEANLDHLQVHASQWLELIKQNIMSTTNVSRNLNSA